MNVLISTIIYLFLAITVVDNTTTQPCSPNPCDPHSSCDTFGSQFAICDPCVGPNAINNPLCRPECVFNSECPFDKACLRNKCTDPCPGSCGVNAECYVYQHDPICHCIDGYEGNPYEHCKVAVIRTRKYILRI